MFQKGRFGVLQAPNGQIRFAGGAPEQKINFCLQWSNGQLNWLINSLNNIFSAIFLLKVNLTDIFLLSLKLLSIFSGHLLDGEKDKGLPGLFQTLLLFF